MKLNYSYGLRRGLPIALGYFPVSFGFGISAVESGINPIMAIIISLTNLTSAGQVAGVGIMAAMGGIIEMIMSQFIINMRYSLMGIALTQKLDDAFGAFHRFTLSFGITDEVFVMSSSEKSPITPSYMYGLITLPILGWVSGTAFGAFSGSILPAEVCAALGIAIYSMFVAIIVPPARDDRGIMWTVIIAAVMSCAIYYVPVFSKYISSGFSIIICAVVASLAMAFLMPVAESTVQEGGSNE